MHETVSSSYSRVSQQTTNNYQPQTTSRKTFLIDDILKPDFGRKTSVGETKANELKLKLISGERVSFAFLKQMKLLRSRFDPLVWSYMRSSSTEFPLFSSVKESAEQTVATFSRLRRDMSSDDKEILSERPLQENIDRRSVPGRSKGDKHLSHTSYFEENKAERRG